MITMARRIHNSEARYSTTTEAEEKNKYLSSLLPGSKNFGSSERQADVPKATPARSHKQGGAFHSAAFKRKNPQ
jgi:hypothetical protein